MALAGATGLALCTTLLAPGVAGAAATPRAAAATAPGVAHVATVATTDYYAPLEAVTANGVTGSGGVWISLTGNTAKFTLQVAGLLAGAPHAAQLWIGGTGRCPGATQATEHNGHKTVAITDETPILGSVGAALTISGDTSGASALAVSRYPTAGAYTYTRTFAVTSQTAAAVRNGTAVLVVHGIDYNHNGKYDTVLGTTPGDAALPAEATDPALCGSFVAAQMKQAVPSGSADTGGGSASAQSSGQSSRAELGLGIAALVAAAGTTVLVGRRRAAGNLLQRR